MGSRRLLDTSCLIVHWRENALGDLTGNTAENARAWAKELAALRGTNLIATPVVLEFLAGVGSSHELTLARAYLDEFEIVDGRNIPKADWDEALRYAQRVPRDGRRRQLGDCLIKAIADRLNCVVETVDRGFPRQRPRR